MTLFKTQTRPGTGLLRAIALMALAIAFAMASAAPSEARSRGRGIAIGGGIVGGLILLNELSKESGRYKHRRAHRDYSEDDRPRHRRSWSKKSKRSYSSRDDDDGSSRKYSSKKSRKHYSKSKRHDDEEDTAKTDDAATGQDEAQKDEAAQKQDADDKAAAEAAAGKDVEDGVTVEEGDADPAKAGAQPGAGIAASVDGDAIISTAPEIKVAQEHLKFLGYDVPSATGTLDSKTKIATIQFQESLGVPTTGELTVNQLQALLVKASEDGAKKK